MKTQTEFLIFDDVPTSEMTFVKGGTFKMGSLENDREQPIHDVTLDDFFIGKYPVTQLFWKKIMNGQNPSYFKDDLRPVEQVSWELIDTEFLPTLNKMTGENFRLPTEAEWEYAARGGQHWLAKLEEDYYGEKIDLNDVGWFDDNSRGKTQPVGLKVPNQLGLYDIIGNVWEWCSDWYGPYSGEAVTNPKGSEPARSHVFRGDSWHNSANTCRCTYRSFNFPNYQNYSIGFRLACECGV
jgi:formylglycine-generating enzyme